MTCHMCPSPAVVTIGGIPFCGEHGNSEVAAFCRDAELRGLTGREWAGFVLDGFVEAVRDRIAQREGQAA
jgi:hypothetical protein